MVLVSFKSISGKTISFELDPTDNFFKVEDLLLEDENFKGINYRFIYKGKRFEKEDCIQSLNYDPTEYVIVAYRPTSLPPPNPPEGEIDIQTDSIPDENPKQFSKEKQEKLSHLIKSGYDPEEALAALEKYNYDFKKARHFLKMQLNPANSDDPNIILRSHFQNYPAVIINKIIAYLANKNPQLADKVESNPGPMLALLGLTKHRPPEDDDEEINELTDQDNISINNLIDLFGLDRGVITDAYIRCNKDENLTANYFLNLR